MTFWDALIIMSVYVGSLALLIVVALWLRPPWNPP
jgi:hypothetical protein